MTSRKGLFTLDPARRMTDRNKTDGARSAGARGVLMMFTRFSGTSIEKGPTTTTMHSCALTGVHRIARARAPLTEVRGNGEINQWRQQCWANRPVPSRELWRVIRLHLVSRRRHVILLHTTIRSARVEREVRNKCAKYFSLG